MSRHSSGKVLPKVILLLALGSALIAVIVVFGAKFLFDRVKKKALPEQTVAIPEPTPTPEEPAEIKLARAAVNGNAEEKRDALNAMAAWPHPQPAVVADLFQSFSASSSTQKLAHLAPFLVLAEKNPQTLDAVASALDDPAIKLETIKTLGDLGPLAKPAAPLLKKMAADKNEKKEVKTAVATALAKIEPKPPAKAKVKKRGKSTKKKRKR